MALVDPFTVEEAMNQLERVAGLEKYVEDSVGPLLRRAGRRLDGTEPEVGNWLFRITELIRSRANTVHAGLDVSRELLIGVVRRIIVRRGHLDPAPDATLPNRWLNTCAAETFQWFQTLPRFSGTLDTTYIFVQGVWTSLNGSGAEKQSSYRERREKRLREEVQQETQAKMMEKMFLMCNSLVDRLAPPPPPTAPATPARAPVQEPPQAPAKVPPQAPAKVPPKAPAKAPAKLHLKGPH